MPNVSHTLCVSVIDNPTNLTLRELFAQVEHQPWSLLFDSANSNDKMNIMVWEPALMVSSKGGQTRVTDTTGTVLSEDTSAPLATVDKLCEALFGATDIEPESQQLAAQLPFLMGAAGLCGYDLGRYYEQLPDNAVDEYACPDMAIGIYHRALIEDATNGVIYDCRLNSIPAFDTRQWMAQEIKNSAFKLSGEWQSNLTQQRYTQAIGHIHNYLKAGDCYQVNMAQRFSAPYQGSEWQAFLTLSDANRAPFSAFMRLPQSCVLSISPERFLSVNQDQVETKPIKGTRPRFTDPLRDKQSADDLLGAEKDRAENLMIVDLLRNDLSKHCQPGSVKVPHLFALESFAAVHHMVSTVTGTLKSDSSPLDLLAGAFPGGSITGAPKIRAMEIIDELEPHRRNVYCGAMMYYGLKRDMDSSICIRTLLAENQTLYCWAGGGIVLDSVAADEYQETLDKVSRILPVLSKMS